MEAIVLAGGMGTRLREVVSDVPKPMAPISGKPFLEYLLKGLSRKGFKRIVLSIGYMSQVIQSHFGERFADMDIVYEIEQSPLGTGGAVRKAMQHCLLDHVFIFNGDTYLELEADEVESLWKKNKRPIIVARDVPDTSRYGRIESGDGKVLALSEKGQGGPGIINAGCYVLPIAALNDFPDNEVFSIEIDFLSHAVKEKVFDLFITQGRFIDIGIPNDYLRAQMEIGCNLA